MGSESVIVLDNVTKVLGKKPRIESLSFACEPGKVIWQHFFGQGYERIRPASLNPAGVM